MKPLKFEPLLKSTIWGGNKIIAFKHLDIKQEKVGESWEISGVPGNESIVADGEMKGKKLNEVVAELKENFLGADNYKRFGNEFPLLIKFIDANTDLSIQVHPDNEYALKNEGQYGKTEMWYVVDAEEGAYLYHGFKKEISKDEFAKRIEEDTLLEVLNKVPVHKGDVFFIEAGTIHAIGKGLIIAEIQQNSNVTYRVYDYGRVGKDGKKRELHIEKALDVTNRGPAKKDGSHYPHIADCDYFTVDKLNLDGTTFNKLEGTVSEKSFLSILVLDGEGTITSNGESVSYKKGDSIFLTAGSGEYSIEGVCDALLTTIRE